MQQTTTHIPDDLQQAINEIYMWVKEGYPKHDYFDTYIGLCSNLSFVSDYESTEINSMLFGENEYPFNSKPGNYHEEDNKYTNPKRLTWLQKHQTVE